MPTEVGIALVGVGMVAPVIADAVGRLGERAVLRGVAASSPTSAEAFLERHRDLVPDGCRVYDTVASIADDPGVTLVLVATPPDARHEIVTQLSAKGKHLLIEKPIERDLAAAMSIVEAAESAGVLLGVFLQHRAKPSTLQLAQMMASGEFGALAMVEAVVPWWRPQRYYDEPGRGTYARDGGGVLLTQAIHSLDLMLSLAGPVEAVTAMTATTRLHHMEAEDFASAGLEFADGAVGHLMASTAAFPGSPEHLAFHHELASARLQSDTVTVSWHDGRVESFGESGGTGSGENPMAFSSEWHSAVIDDMVNAITDDREPLVSGRDALAVHRFIDAVEQSASVRTRVEIR